MNSLEIQDISWKLLVKENRKVPNINKMCLIHYTWPISLGFSLLDGQFIGVNRSA